MSWLQWRGKTLSVTDDEAELQLHLWRPNAACPRQSWSLAYAHFLPDPPPDAPPGDYIQMLEVEVNELHFHEADWRQFAGREIRADAAWQDAHEYLHEYGRLVRAVISVGAVIEHRGPDDSREVDLFVQWVGEDFILRFGTRDGITFPCELDAWLMPKESWERKEPETEAEAARPPEGPPTLRLIAPASFSHATLDMPRCGDDPTPLAARYLLEQARCDHLPPREVRWAARREPKCADSLPMPGWTSTVEFRASADP